MSKTLYFTVEGAIILAGFGITVVWFNSGEFLTSSPSLLPFWFLPLIFCGTAVLFKKLAAAGVNMHWLFHYIFYSIAGGTWLGLSLESVLILNEWYRSSGSNGRLEPLFTATGLSTAAILTAQRIVGKISGRKEEEEEEEDEDPPVKEKPAKS